MQIEQTILTLLSKNTDATTDMAKSVSAMEANLKNLGRTMDSHVADLRDSMEKRDERISRVKKDVASLQTWRTYLTGAWVTTVTLFLVIQEDIKNFLFNR